MDTRILGAAWLASGFSTGALAVWAVAALRRMRPAPWLHAGLGALAWLVAATAKLAAAMVLFALLPRKLPVPAVMLATGLLTGVFECGAVRAFSLLGPLRRPDWNHALVFGAGLGCFEAVVLAGLALLRGAVVLCAPLLPASTAHEVLSSVCGWDGPGVLILERIIAMPVHVLACVWILRSIWERRPGMFWAAFLLKSGIDALPVGALPQATLEAVYLLFGLGSLALLLREDAACGKAPVLRTG